MSRALTLIIVAIIVTCPTPVHAQTIASPPPRTDAPHSFQNPLFVARDTKGTTTIADDTFKLVFDGVTHHLVLVDGAQNLYRTRDDTFLRIQYENATDSWTVTTKDGTRHSFAAGGRRPEAVSRV